MTEQKNASAMVEDTAPADTAAADTAAAPAGKPSREKKSGGKVLSAVAIVIALAIGAGLYLNGKHQADLQAQTNHNLSEQLAALQQQLNNDKQQLTQQLANANSALQQALSQQDSSTKELASLRDKVASLSGNDTRNWLLAQADYLVKLAGRKLWIDQDVTTAAALLKSADTSLAEMNDSGVMNVRRALTQDISSLSVLSQVDYDSIILKLNQLSNGVDNLRLADNDSDESPMDTDNGELSSSLREWRQNLVKSWHNFIDDFITIRRRDNTAQPLLAPNQDVYLRENIRSRLLIAAQAVPRHQEEIYKQSIDAVSAWIRAWYDTNDAATKVFLAQLDELSQQSISMNVSDTLESQTLLNKLMQTRVRNLLAQPSVPAQQQGG